MTASSEIRTLYISDDAYDELVHQAKLAGYAHRDSAHGLSDFVEWLFHNCYFIDTRPEDVKAQDADMLSVGMAPEWRLYSPRRRRRLTLSNGALALASVEATALNMAFAPVRRILGAPTYLDGVQCMSVLLEAIGTDWVGVRRRDE